MLAVFGIDNDGLNLAVNLLILFAVVLWLALVYWTFADARRRIADGMLIACAVAASFLFPFVGTVVYAIVRPPEYLDDVYEREASIDASETLVRVLGELEENQRELSRSVARLEQQLGGGAAGAPRRRPTRTTEQQTVEHRTAFD
jgi:hypothetical protein